MRPALSVFTARQALLIRPAAGSPGQHLRKGERNVLRLLAFLAPRISMPKKEDVMDLVRMSMMALLLGSSLLSGCGLIAAGTAGGVAGSELSEDDEDFDPLENTEVGQEVDEEVDDAVEDMEE